MDRGNFNVDAMRLVDPVLVEAEMVRREHQLRLKVRIVVRRFRYALLWRAPRFPNCFNVFS